MMHYVPDMDAGSSELDNPHSPSLGSQKCDKEEEKCLSAKKKNACMCAMDNHLSRMEAEIDENHAHTYTVSRASALAVDVPVSFQEDEMLSWIQYPLDDSFSKSYCSDQLYEPPFTPYPAQSSTPKPTSQNSEKLVSTSFTSQLPELSDSGVGLHTPTSEMAMAMGAYRAAGLLPHNGAEAFNTVHTIRHSSPETSSCCIASDIHNVEDNHAGEQNARNFSFFSERVAAMKTSLQILGTSSGPSNKERLKQPLNTESSKKSSSIELSTGTVTLTSVSPREDSYLRKRDRETTQASELNVQQKFPDRFHSAHIVGKAKTQISARSAAAGSEILEMGGVILSLSDASDYSTEKSAREMPELNCKRKQSPAEEFECDSKDFKRVASHDKDSTLNQPNSARRFRAAEIHNQSERRRRNKINEKMRALQELIPNANKTDKASMLDEAIEYVKMLQAQLQLMSMRTGMVVPPVMMPPGMEYLARPQRQDPPQMNNGMGINGGVPVDSSYSGVGGLPRPAFPGQPLPLHAYHLSGYWPNGLPYKVPSSMNPNNRQTITAYQQLQVLQSPRTANIYMAHTHADSDTQQQH